MKKTGYKIFVLVTNGYTNNEVGLFYGGLIIFHNGKHAKQRIF